MRDRENGRVAGPRDGEIEGCVARRRHRAGREEKKNKITTEDTEDHGGKTQKKPSEVSVSTVSSVPSVVKALPTPIPPASSTKPASSGPVKRAMPSTVRCMLAESISEPFDSREWLFEIKWDGYRAVAFIENGKVRLVSRNQNELTPRYPELKDLPRVIKAKNAILDGEVVALDEHGKASFSLMQQRTGFRPGGKRAATKADVPVLYYAFDLLYVDGEDWRRVPLEDRKRKLATLVTPGDSLRFSDHYEEHGKALFEIARSKGLEGIVAKRRASCYEESRSRDWLKIKIRHQLECVVGGFTEPEGSRAHFGSLVLGLYDKQGRLIHVGQAGSGFNQKSLAAIMKTLKGLETKKNPFFGEVEALRRVSWVKPELVAHIEYAEWTEGANTGSGPKLRAPVFLGLRDDKDPKECTLEQIKESS
jgi:DNA polymerase LigD, ligase domain